MNTEKAKNFIIQKKREFEHLKGFGETGLHMFYKLAEESEIESIFSMVTSAILEMEKNGIFQWDSVC